MKNDYSLSSYSTHGLGFSFLQNADGTDNFFGRTFASLTTNKNGTDSLFGRITKDPGVKNFVGNTATSFINKQAIKYTVYKPPVLTHVQAQEAQAQAQAQAQQDASPPPPADHTVLYVGGAVALAAIAYLATKKK